MKGYFISFEGNEGCGKSTQIRLVAENLRKQGHDVIVTKEPGGCPIADKIRAILLDIESANMDSTCELMLYAASRAQHVNEVIVPALKAGKIVLCDRYADSTYAYQGFGRNLDKVLIKELNKIATGGVWPHLTLWLDIPVDVGLGRAIDRNNASSGPDESRFEAEAKEFHTKCREGFLELYNTQERVKRVDANDEIEVVLKDIIKTIEMNMPIKVG